MANTSAIADSFRTEVLNGIHALGASVVRGATTKDALKAALYFATATINAASTVYTVTGEATGTGYTAGGVAVDSSVAPAVTASISYWTPGAALAWTTVTLSAVDTVMLYNSTQGNKMIMAINFGSQTVTAGNFTLNVPTNNQTTGLLRLA
jgi:hypothetical protein